MNVTGCCIVQGMLILLKTTNLVRLSFFKDLLSDSGICTKVFDENILALEAEINIFPRCLMVEKNLWLAAKNILFEAGEFYDG